MNIINSLLESLDSDIQNLIAAYAEAHQKHFQRPMSKWDLEMTKLTVTWDLLKSIEKYTHPQDLLLSAQSSVSKKGNLEISARIQRDGLEYSLMTEVIYAGGWNIQRLHYRYITHTNLPKTGASLISEEYATQIKKMNKRQKLEEQLQIEERWVANYQEKMDRAQRMTDEQIIEELKRENQHALYGEVEGVEQWTWEKMNPLGQKNWGSKELFEQRKKEDLQQDLVKFKHLNITVMKSYLKDALKTVEKTKAKIAAL